MSSDVKNLIAIIVSAYAALISTIALIWNIINTILDKASKIEVHVDFYETFGIANNNTEEGPRVLQISIVNKSKRVKYIKVPQLKLSYNHGFDLTKKDKNRNIVNLFLQGSKVTFPIEMKPESEVVLKYPMSKGSEWICENAKKNDKFRVIITDTTNKKYKSKRIKIVRIQDCIKHNLEVNPDLISLIIKSN